MAKPAWMEESESAHVTATLLVVEGDSAAWVQALEVIACPRKGIMKSPEKARLALVNLRKEKCAVRDSVVTQDDNSTLYTLTSPGCNPAFPEEFSVTRILVSKATAYTEIYTC